MLEEKEWREKTSEKEVIKYITKSIEDMITSEKQHTSIAANLKSANEAVILVNCIYAELRNTSNEITSYLNKRYLEIDSMEETIGKLENEINNLNDRLDEKTTECEKLNKALENFNREQLKCYEDKLNAIDNRIEDFMSLVNTYAKAMAFNKNAKDKKIKPALREDVSTDEIIKLYNNGNGLTITEIGKRVNMTPNAVRARLIQKCVYRSKRKDFGSKRGYL